MPGEPGGDSHPGRGIIHCDMDAFYAAVEQLDDPGLRGQPVIVGGDLRRGVVSACSYEARAMGVHSAMPMARAVRLCPRAALRRVRMERYRRVSRQVFAILERFTDRIEPLSIDEAFLDVTGCDRLFGPPAEIAARIRSVVREELGLAASAGVAPNKFLAKLASAAAKPDGLLVITPAEVQSFLDPLPVESLWGVGEVVAGRLRGRGLTTVARLRSLDRPQLTRLLGRFGDSLYDLARGRDDRPVVAGEGIKSVSHEKTFAEDLCDQKLLQRELRDLAERVARRLRAAGLRGKRVTLKLRYGDFSLITRSRTLDEGVDNGLYIYRTGCDLLAQTEAGRRPVRLLGVGVADWAGEAGSQGLLFGERDDGQRRRVLDQALDRLQDRYGAKGARPAALLAETDEESAAEQGPDRGE